MTLCPYCDATVANVQEEVKHMQAEHPEIIEQRLIKAGFRKDTDGQWVDILTNND